MVGNTLTILDEWYREETTQERPKMISKLALLELCGWLENWMDEFIITMKHDSNCKDTWINKEVIGKNNGFHYAGNFRLMLTKVVGEYFASIIEARYEAKHPGDLERLKTYLGSLKVLRNDLAHNQYNSPVITQAHFHAPSYVKANFYDNLEILLENFKDVSLQVRSEFCED